MSRHPLAVLAGGLALAAALLAPTGAAAADPFTVTALNFKVAVGPAGDKTCNVVGDLYLPRSASSSKRVPAILTTNGFGGSKADQAGLARYFAKRGYAVLSYSGLGFGGSGCQITLDDPDYDGRAASQLISYLAGRPGIAFTDAAHTAAAPRLRAVRLDRADDPRVGMIGVSYGGGIQFATASVDKRLDTIIPGATWNDLSYSLAPNNTTQVRGVTTSTPGAAKLLWALGFTASGVSNGVQNLPADPGRILPCPNFATFVCPGLVTAGLTGTLDASTRDHLRHASVTSYVSKVRVPTLLLQGQADTLFNLNEATATFQALRKQGTPTKLVWVNGGHSGPMAKGEIDFGAPDYASQHVTKRVTDWFDHYLKGTSASTGPLFTYFRDWVDYTGSARPAYASSSTFPVGTAKRFYLSGASGLTTSTSRLTKGSTSFLTPVAGLPTSSDPLDVVSSVAPSPLPETDLPGTAGTWTSGALGSRIDVVGSPRLTLRVDAPLANLSAVDALKLVLFVKVLDVDTTGKATLVRDLVAPVRVADVTKPFTATLPAFAHRFAPGHQVRLVVAGGSTNYRGGTVPTPVTVSTGSTSQVLSLPVVR